jgi:hypothetical protein
MKNKFRKFAVGAAALAALTTPGWAQSVDALLDKLVDKGVLSVKEANQLREESDKNFTTAMQSKLGMPDWVQALRLSGDVRGRYEMFDSDNSLFTERQRLRYRMRFGVTATLLDDFEAGFRLGSGDLDGSASSLSSGVDPISNNQTFQNNASKKGIFLDQAYGKWAPLKGPNLSAAFTIGKMENPFVFSDLVFDGDYTPEGLAAQFAYRFNDKHSVKLNGGWFMLDELAASSHDPYLLGAQARWDANWSPKFNTTLGAAYLTLCNEENLTNSAVPNINRGNTRNADGNLIYSYQPWIVDAAATYTLASFPFYKGTFPIKVAGDYMVNCGAPSGSDNYGYSVGVQFGKSGKKGTWDLSYAWKWLGANAWWEELVDSDFGAFYAQKDSPPNSGKNVDYGSGTNVKGHIVRFAYSPSDSFTLSVKWFLTQLINQFPAGSDSEMNRLQVDAMWKF